jgi:hypothetical protein
MTRRCRSQTKAALSRRYIARRRCIRIPLADELYARVDRLPTKRRASPEMFNIRTPRDARFRLRRTIRVRR